MRLVTLPTGYTILLNTAALALIQTLIAYLFTRLPLEAFCASSWPYRAQSWERDGAVYDAVRVRRWKQKLPSGGAWLGGFSMLGMSSTETDYLERWLAETCRAELAHWAQIAIIPIFILWNPPIAAMIIFLYALAANLPCIIAQRRNRPRLQRLLARQQRQAATGGQQKAAQASDSWTAVD